MCHCQTARWRLKASSTTVVFEPARNECRKFYVNNLFKVFLSEVTVLERKIRPNLRIKINNMNIILWFRAVVLVFLFRFVWNGS